MACSSSTRNFTKLKSLDLTRAEILSSLNQTETKFTVDELKSFETGHLSIQKRAELEQLLKDWLKNYEEQVKTGEPSRKKLGVKFGYIKGTILSCPHCTLFAHTRQHEIDKHIFEAHETYPYSCSVCRKGFRYPNTVNSHMKDFHSTVA